MFLHWWFPGNPQGWHPESTRAPRRGWTWTAASLQPQFLSTSSPSTWPDSEPQRPDNPCSRAADPQGPEKGLLACSAQSPRPRLPQEGCPSPLLREGKNPAGQTLGSSGFRTQAPSVSGTSLLSPGCSRRFRTSRQVGPPCGQTRPGGQQVTALGCHRQAGA